MNANFLKLTFLLVVFSITACTRSLDTQYKPGLELNSRPETSEMTIGVAKFEDKRSFVRASDKKSVSYIATAGAWQFGLTHNGREFVPVSELVQDLFVTELGNAGFKSTKLSDAVNAESDLILSGQIINFEFANDTGVWTVTSRRTVTLAIDLRKRDNTPVFLGQMFNETSTEGEGMGVLHSTNVDKLMNSVFKKVLASVIARVAESYAINESDVMVEFHFEGGAKRLALN